MKPAKRSKTEEKKQTADDAKEKKLEELADKIDQLVAEEEDKKNAITTEYLEASKAARREMVALAREKVPGFWKECLCYNMALRSIISKEDEAVLETMSELHFDEDDSMQITVSMKFEGSNNEFTNKELKRSFGGLPDAEAKTTGVNWKPGRKPHDRNTAEGRSLTDPDCVYSLFELFEDGELDESEVVVLSELRKIVEDPIAAYLGQDDDDDEDSDEALELGEE
eukprot:TRINITY_DN16715_c0_g1_i1.p3 TRINITY_DN16715_c0_g1~~TRINITY_DN16715_c0_g1_i1.p3  ORF type:complete len:225 (+),score=119.43 TRINITY_DN16715_c0_g1_i1:1291-1965(+)